ncbi:MAG: DNA-binding response [Rhodospirillaceae bacterium]|nr:MAG: DNA-binding response [Rhodospirillaceae bacterium]TNC97514.1 MAG: DNA-binding response regulator [Stygiobacter sp.]
METALPSRPRILVIDDDPAIRQILAELLEQAGYAVGDQGDMADFQVVLTSAPLSDCPLPQVTLTKPVRLAALAAAIALALAQAVAPAQIGPWRFDQAARLLEKDGDKVRLTDKEAAILAHLLAAANVVGRDELLARVWGYGSDITTHTLETHIYRLRQKIEADPSQACLLLTEAGGYRLNPES